MTELNARHAMHYYAPYISWIETQEQRLLRRVNEWVNINSFSFNLQGLEVMLNRLTQEFALYRRLAHHRFRTQLSVDRARRLSLPPILDLRSLRKIRYTRRVFSSAHRPRKKGLQMGQ